MLAALGLAYFPGLGAVEVASAMVGLPSRDELVSMRVAYGLVVGFLPPATLFLLAARPTGAAAPVQQVLAAAVAFLLTAAASGLWTALVGGVGLLVLGAALGRLARGIWALHLRHPVLTTRSWCSPDSGQSRGSSTQG